MRVCVRCPNESYKRRRSSAIPCVWLFLISAVTPNALAQEVSDTTSKSSYTDSAEIEYPSGGGGTIDPNSPPKRFDQLSAGAKDTFGSFEDGSDGTSAGTEPIWTMPRVKSIGSSHGFWSPDGGGATSGRGLWEYPSGGGGTIGGGGGGGGTTGGGVGGGEAGGGLTIR